MRDTDLHLFHNIYNYLHNEKNNEKTQYML